MDWDKMCMNNVWELGWLQKQNHNNGKKLAHLADYLVYDRDGKQSSVGTRPEEVMLGPVCTSTWNHDVTTGKTMNSIKIILRPTRVISVCARKNRVGPCYLKQQLTAAVAFIAIIQTSN